MSETSTWDPGQYNRFAAEREKPFWDLAGLLEPLSSPRVVDLGCGDGRLTAALHDKLGAAGTTGIDSSPAMLAAAGPRARGGVSFSKADISSWTGRDLDVVFSNAALQWVPDHAGVLERWTAALGPGGQLAVQMPTNADHPSHRVARALAAEWLGDRAPADPVEQNVLVPQAYAALLHDLGFELQHVRMQVYGHVLASTADLVEWVKGTSLTRFKAILGTDHERFVDEYRRRLVTELGDHRPYFYAFKRILLWGRRA